MVEIKVNPEDEPKFFCKLCLDEPNGWRVFWCDGWGHLRGIASRRDHRMPASDCGRFKVHVGHPFAARCECWQHNPVVEEQKRRFSGRA